MSFTRLGFALVIAQCLFCIGVSAQGTDSGSGSANPPSASSKLDETQYGPIRKIGGGVSPPIVTYQAKPKLSKQASEANPFMASILVGLIVDREGKPQDVRIVRGGVGMGLEENAVEAVGKYRFKPAMENGSPVAVRINVEVNFTKR